MTGDSAARIADRTARLKALGPRPPWYRPFARRRWRRAFTAIMAMDVSEMAEMLTRLYPTEGIVGMAERRHPVLSMLGKDCAR